MEVRVVNWRGISQDSHKEILDALPIGEYVESLPYAVPDGLKTFRIPLYGGRILEFRRIAVVNRKERKGEYIWQKS